MVERAASTAPGLVVGSDHEFARTHGPALRASHVLTDALGSPWAFIVSGVGVALFLVVGVTADFPRSWELVGTLGIPLLALWALFGLQHSQNHNDRAVQLKLDELLRALDRADDRLVAVEDVNEGGLQELRAAYRSELVED